MRRGRARLIASAVLLLFGVLYLFPFYWMGATALKSLAELYRYPPTLAPSEPTLTAFVSVLVRRGYVQHLQNSVMVCFAAVAFAIVVSLLLTYPITRMPVSPRFRRGLLGWILSLRFLPPIVVVIPFFDIIRRMGLYDTRSALVLLYTVFSLPFSVWMLKGFLSEIPMEMEEAAMVDGATRTQAFFRIILPQLSPALLATAVITFSLMWSEFMFAFILTATPRAQTFSIGVASLVTQFEIIWNDMAAVGIVSALVPITLLLMARRYVVSALTFGVIREKS